MSFTPLPDALATRLRREPGLRVLDLGCGDGRFGRVLADHGADPVGLDRWRPDLGSAARVVGDVARPPLLTGRWPVVVAANLVRHLEQGPALVRIVRTWLELLAPGGDLFLLEDAPGGRSPAQKNYEALQQLLAGLPGRGPLLARAEIQPRLEATGGRVVAAGSGDNVYALDAASVITMLESGAPRRDTPAAALAEAIRRDGVACGRFWWVLLRRTGGVG